MKNIFLTIVTLCVTQLSFSQVISGIVLDSETKKNIPYAKVYIPDFQIGTISDSVGKFVFNTSIPSNVSLLVTSSMYESKMVTVNPGELIVVAMERTHLELDEVVLIIPNGVMQKDNTVRVDRLNLKDLKTIPASTLSEAIANLNGVQEASIGIGISKPVIRGMQGVRVLTAWNGMRIENQQWGADHGMAVSQIGIGSVEVIKGPSSLLYGADALGGVVYLAEEKFSRQNAYSVVINSKFESVNLGTTNTAMIKMSKRNMRFNFGALYSNFSDYKMPNNTYLADSRYQDMGAKARFAVNKENWVMNVNYIYSHSYLGLPGHTHDTDPNPNSFMLSFQNRQRNIPAQNINNHLVQMDNKFFFGQNKIQLMLGYTHNDFQEFEEKVSLPGLGMVLQNGLYHARFQRKMGAWSINAGIQGMYQVNRNIAKAEDELIPNFNQLDNGVYAIANYKTRSNFSFQFGSRYDVRILNTSNLSNTYDSPNFSIGGKYFWGKNSKNTLRLNISTGYRAPHVSELLADGIHHGTLRYEIGNQNLKSEKATQFDLNYEFERDHVSFVLNPFYNYIQNFTQIVAQDTMIDMFPVYRYEQQGESHLYGVDLGFHYHPHFAHWLHVETSYSLIYGESLNEENMSLMPQPRLNNLVRLTFKKRFKFNLEEVVIQHMKFFEQNRVTTFESESVEYGLLNAGFNFKWYLKQPIEISLGVKNALNTRYANHLSKLKNIGVYSPGRNFCVSLTYQLDDYLKKSN